jgi:hypothetical protein
MLGISLMNAGARTGRRPGISANENRPSRRVLVKLVPTAPISITEVEVFDHLIGSFAGFAANDNEHPKPNPNAMHDPPEHSEAERKHANPHNRTAGNECR